MGTCERTSTSQLSCLDARGRCLHVAESVFSFSMEQQWRSYTSNVFVCVLNHCDRSFVEISNKMASNINKMSSVTDKYKFVSTAQQCNSVRERKSIAWLCSLCSFVLHCIHMSELWDESNDMLICRHWWYNMQNY